MPRVRVGVVLLLPAPICEEVQGLRRAVGDGSLERIPPHLTLLSPVNVPEARLDEALDALRQAAAATRAFRLTLGPPGTFLPDNPVLFLGVGGDLTALHRLRGRVLREPLARPAAWPFVPHVTLADDAPHEVIEAGLTALAHYRAEVTFQRVHLLRQGDDRVWSPMSDASFEAPAVIGRGGLPLELTVSEHLDSARHPERHFAITARRDGLVVGTATGGLHGEVAHLDRLVVEPSERRQGIGSHLLAAVQSLAAKEGSRSVMAKAPIGSIDEVFLRSRGWSECGREQTVHLLRELRG